MLFMEGPIEVLRKKICRIVAAGDFQKLKILRLQSVLDPQISDREVPDSPESPAPADPDRGGRVTVDPETEIEAHVCAHCL